MERQVPAAKRVVHAGTLRLKRRSLDSDVDDRGWDRMRRNRCNIVTSAFGPNDANTAWIVEASTLVSTTGSTVAVTFRRTARPFHAVASVRNRAARTQHWDDQERTGNGDDRCNAHHITMILISQSQRVNTALAGSGITGP